MLFSLGQQFIILYIYIYIYIYNDLVNEHPIGKCLPLSYYKIPKMSLFLSNVDAKNVALFTKRVKVYQKCLFFGFFYFSKAYFIYVSKGYSSILLLPPSILFIHLHLFVLVVFNGVDISIEIMAILENSKLSLLKLLTEFMK